MKVKDLIAHLLNHNPDKEVYILPPRGVVCFPITDTMEDKIIFDDGLYFLANVRPNCTQARPVVLIDAR